MTDKIFFVHKKLGMMVDLDTIKKYGKQRIGLKLVDNKNQENEYVYEYREIPISDDWIPMVDSIIGGK